MREIDGWTDLGGLNAHFICIYKTKVLRALLPCTPFGLVSSGRSAPGGQGATENIRLHQAAFTERSQTLVVELQLWIATEG